MSPTPHPTRNIIVSCLGRRNIISDGGMEIEE